MKRSLATLAVVTVAGLVPAGAAMAATGGYGPSAPTGPAGAPGGYSSVVVAKTVSASGGALSASVSGAQLSVNVPSGAFSGPVQVEVTAPALSAVSSSLSSLGFSGYTAVAGVGVKVLTTTGQPVAGSFAKPLTVTLTGAQLGRSGEKVLEFTSPTSVSTLTDTLGNGSVSFQISADPDLAVVNPPAASGSTVPGATSVHTGKPFTGETDLAVVLIGGGALALLASARKRRTAHQS